MSDDEEEDVFTEIPENVAKMAIKNTKFYLNGLKAILKQIEAEEPTDRLDYARAISNCCSGALLTISGWKSCVEELDNLSVLTIKDLKEVYPKLKDVIIKLLEIDIAITERKLVESTVSLANSKNNSSTYVA